jgi:hypothetical protein
MLIILFIFTCDTYIPLLSLPLKHGFHLSEKSQIRDFSVSQSSGMVEKKIEKKIESLPISPMFNKSFFITTVPDHQETWKSLIRDKGNGMLRVGKQPLVGRSTGSPTLKEAARETIDSLALRIFK